MTQNDFKRLLEESLKPIKEEQIDLRKSLEDSLKPIRDEQIKFKKSVDKSFGLIRKEQTKFKKTVDKSFDSIREEQKSLTEEQKELRKFMEERILPPVIYVETTIKSYADRYVANEDHIRRLDKRLSAVEEDLGIHPPQELSIPILD